MPQFDASEAALRRWIRNAGRLFGACAILGFLIAMSVRDGSTPPRSYVAAVFGIIGIIGFGLTFIGLFILNAWYVGRRLRAHQRPPTQ